MLDRVAAIERERERERETRPPGQMSGRCGQMSVGVLPALRIPLLQLILEPDMRQDEGYITSLYYRAIRPA